MKEEAEDGKGEMIVAQKNFIQLAKYIKDWEFR